MQLILECKSTRAILIKNVLYFASEGITYDILSGNEEGWFGLHPSSGIITVVSTQLDRETKSEVKLSVTAQDNQVWSIKQFISACFL